ncbi:MAG: ABC transporter substrate-binding protein [Prosthecochloris sp.]|nr:ABC transporter substrate-binding protein [Prosthecochloris sp.]
MKPVITPVILLILFLASCTPPSPQEKPGSRTITDMAGRTMIVPDTISRIYVNRPGSILVYAVAPDLIVNRSFNFTPEAARFLSEEYLALPHTEGSAEEILNLGPDLILTFFDINPGSIDEADKLAERTGIPVYLASLALEDYPEVFRRLGRLLDRQEQTERMQRFIDEHVDPVLEQATTIDEAGKLSVYYAEGDRGLHTDPAGSIHSRLIDMTGGVNAADIDVVSRKGLSEVSMEQLIMWDPDVVLVWAGLGTMTPTMEHIQNDPLWSRLRASQNDRIYQVPYLPFGWFDRPASINRLLGIPWLADLLYPDLYGIDIEDVVAQYFRVFYHYELDSEETQTLLNP